jgi:threonine dehydrogenase-like Zn-dependent dehydrogenase
MRALLLHPQPILRHDHPDPAPAIVALELGRVDPRPLISRVFPLDDAPAAFAAAGRSPNFKVLLKP